MKSNYSSCLEKVLKHEGGYTNDAADPGGPTNFGITIYDYRKYINPKGTAEDVKRMKLEQAKEIYKSKYWDALKCDELPSGVDYVVFDYGVNSGISRSAKVLQKKVGIDVDGFIGPVTIAATKAVDAKKLINSLCDERMTFLKNLKTFSVFGKGWTKRVSDVREHSLSLVGKAEQPGVGTGVGVGVGGIGLAGWFQTHMWKILIGTAIVAVAGYVIVRWYKTRIQPRIVENVEQS